MKVFVFVLPGLFWAFFPVFGRSLEERYPDRLLGSDFGIVTADDLAYDAEHREASPYDPEKRLFARYWKCFPVKNVAPKFRTWRDSMTDYGRGIQTLCDLELEARDGGTLHVYGFRRAVPNRSCSEFSRRWRKLTSGENVVCLNGEDPGNDEDSIHGKHRGWIWDKFKTHKGCYGYFDDCDVSGCAQGKCPE